MTMAMKQVCNGTQRQQAAWQHAQCGEVRRGRLSIGVSTNKYT